MSTIDSWKAFLFMLGNGCVGTGPQGKVDTREWITAKNEPWGSPYNDSRNKKNSDRGVGVRPLLVN